MRFQANGLSLLNNDQSIIKKHDHKWSPETTYKKRGDTEKPNE
jgi:hypothetical protein